MTCRNSKQGITKVFGKNWLYCFSKRRWEFGFDEHRRNKKNNKQSSECLLVYGRKTGKWGVDQFPFEDTGQLFPDLQILR